jgi:hypothetical protein
MPLGTLLISNERENGDTAHFGTVFVVDNPPPRPEFMSETNRNHAGDAHPFEHGRKHRHPSSRSVRKDVSRNPR